MEKVHPERGIVENPLSPLQRQLLWKVGVGLSNEEIAQELVYTYQHIKNNLTQAVARLVTHGYISEVIRDEHIGRDRGTTMYAAIIAAEHGLIPNLPADEERRQELEFIKRYVGHGNPQTTES